MALPATTRSRYLTAETALNIPTPEGTGDWHFAETFEGYGGRRPGRFCVAGVDTLDTTLWLGQEGLFDARSRLEPYGLHLPPGPVYAADHYRALADRVITAVVAGEAFEDCLLLEDWLPEAEEQERLMRLLEKARPALSALQWRRIVAWGKR
ncbi:hypothetical protein JWZ97_19840 (plasmid) [Methylococcus sp. EFPC2]|nr:hypothetical protein JWZ97_19840 [Methylococcus sp. EFPC2]